MTPFYSIVSTDSRQNLDEMRIWFATDYDRMIDNVLIEMDEAEAEQTSVFLVDPAKGTAQDVTKAIALDMADRWLEDYEPEDDDVRNAPGFVQAHQSRYLDEQAATIEADAFERSKGLDAYYGARARI